MSEHFDPYHVWLGIPSEDQPPNHYRLLGLRMLESDPDVISNALDQRLAFLRTFQAGKRAALSQKLLNEVSAAGVVLLSREKKEQYDRTLRGQLNPPPATASSAASLPVARPLQPAPSPAPAISPAISAAPSAPWTSGPAIAAPPAPAPPAPAPPVAITTAPKVAPAFVPATMPRGSVAPRGEEPAPNPHLMPLIAATVGLAGLLVLAFGGWWLLSGMRTTDGNPPAVAANRPGGKRKPIDIRNYDMLEPSQGGSIGTPVIDTPVIDKPGIDRPGIAKSQTTALATPSTGDPGLTVKPTWVSNGATPPTVTAVDAGKAWLADGPEKLAIRLSGGRWVELRENEEYWYNIRDASPSQYLLADSLRKVELRLRDAEVSLRTPSQDWAALGPGRWVDVAELPPFAQRPRGPAPTDPTAFRQPLWHALMFDGRSALRMSLPPEIAPEHCDFTVEAWLRFGAWPSRSEVNLMNAGSLAVHVAPSPNPSDPEARMLRIFAEGAVRPVAWPLATERWTHWALVRQGNQLRLFIDGQTAATLSVSDQFTLDGAARSVVFGQHGGSTSSGFTGLLRDFRVSKVARYSGPFTPSLRFEADTETLVLPKFLADPQTTVQDLATAGRRITRDKAQWVALSPIGELAGSRLDGSLDLTRLYSVSNHTLSGRFQRTSDHTDTLTPSGPALVLVPHRPPSNYDVELEATRQEGDGGLLLGLVLGDKQAILAIDAFPQHGRRTGIVPSALASAATASSLTGHAPLLVTGNRQRFVVKVRQPTSQTYSIQVSCDGKDHASFQGNVAELGVPSELASPLTTSLSLGSLDTKVRFHSLQLRPIASSSSVAPTIASTASFGGTTTSSPTSASPPRVPAPRLPVPGDEELTRRLAEARTIFQDQLKEAVKPAQKASLARIILTASNNTKSDKTARYVLIDLARKVFIQAGEVNESLAAARTLEKEFEVAEDELYIATLEALDDMTLPPEQRSILGKIAIDLSDELLAAEEFDEAEKLSTIAAQSANKQKDADLKKDIVQRRGQIVRVVTAAKAAQPSMAVLTTKPDDPAANLVVGKFRCMVREDWEAGLAHLVKSGDPLFAAPATLDLATSSGKPADLAAAGEAWLKLVADTKTISRDDRPPLQRRAKLHLVAAASGLTGLDRVRIEKRLDELKDVGAAANKRTAKSRAPRATPLPGLIGRVNVRGQDAGIIVTYQPGYTVTQEDVQRLQAAAGVTAGDSWRIDLLGILTLAADSQVQLRHVGGSVSGGVHTLFIGSQSVSEIGDDRSKDDTRQLPLPKGQHPIRWTLTGGDLGTAHMSLIAADAAGNPQQGVAAIQYLREMNVLTRSIPYKTEIKWGPE